MLLLRYAAHIFFKEVADLGADLFLVEHLPRQIIGIFPQVNLCEIDAHEFVHIKTPAFRVVSVAPSQTNLRASLLVDDSSQYSIKAAKDSLLLPTHPEYLERACRADIVAYAFAALTAEDFFSGQAFGHPIHNIVHTVNGIRPTDQEIAFR